MKSQNQTMYNKAIITVFLFLVSGVLIYYTWMNEPLFYDGESKVLYDRNGRLLGASVASDGQWRFPERIDVPKKFALSILCAEDHRFVYHRGIDPKAVMRAIMLNIKNRKIVSGASTITMQLARMSEGKNKRTFLQKGIEALKSLLIEIKYSKKEILAAYASHAPYGGNVVGLDAASWRYFNKDPEMLTWAESATLAVLPNAPGLIHPGRNRDQLLKKRDRLLLRLKEERVLNNHDYELALLEPLPKEPYPLPRMASHLMDRKGSKSGLHTTIDYSVQQSLLTIGEDHHRRFSQKGIHNIGILVVNNEHAEVNGYLGNIQTEHEGWVDMVYSTRSSGSILKPFLYASMMQKGKISPDQLLADVPTNIRGFNPKNYNKSYSGAVSASEALAKSLNVPAVKMLQEYGVEAFRQDLNQIGFTTFNNSSDHYGLSLILGGGEISLWEMVNAYSRCAQKLTNYGREREEKNITFSGEASPSPIDLYDEGVIFTMFNAMREVIRPEVEGGWEHFQSSIPMAWKTGTSYGHRDAWAVGVTPQYTIGVWVGNSDGEGRPEIIGSSAAGSVLFTTLHSLPIERRWFDVPHDEMAEARICRHSGFLQGPYCDRVDTTLVPTSSMWAMTCPHHYKIYLNEDGQQVDRSCREGLLVSKSWFQLPADMAYYYVHNHADYKLMPPFAPGCNNGNHNSTMALLYPGSRQALFLPKGLNGELKSAVFKATHEDLTAKIFWHLDEKYLGDTREIHHMKINIEPGTHKIKLVDGYGNEVNRTFEVVGDQ